MTSTLAETSPLIRKIDFAHVFRMTTIEMIEQCRLGRPADQVFEMADRMGLTRNLVIDILKMSRTSIARRAETGESLKIDETERLLGLIALVGQVEVMIEESSNVKDFDCAKWMGKWLVTEVPALGGVTPAQYVATLEGRRLLSRLLSASQSGSFM